MSDNTTKAPHLNTGKAPRRVTVADVRASFNHKVKSHLSVRWFGRPISHRVTPAFYNAGWSANGVTYLRIVIATAGLGALLAPPPVWPAIAATVYYICFVLDCVDGNIARLRNTVTYWGKYLDGLADSVFVLGAPVAAGVGIWLHGGDGIFMLGGALASIASLASQMARSRLSFVREWMTNQSGPISDATLSRAARPRRLQWLAAAVYVNGRFFAPLLLLVPGNGPALYVMAMLATQLAPEIVWLAATLAEGRILLDRPRRSIHSPVEALDSVKK